VSRWCIRSKSAWGRVRTGHEHQQRAVDPVEHVLDQRGLAVEADGAGERKVASGLE